MKTALIVVDMQNYYLLPESDFYRFSEYHYPNSMEYITERCRQIVIPNIQKLLTFFRERKWPVIFLRLCSQKADRSDLLKVFRDVYLRGKKIGLDSVYPLSNEKMADILEDIYPLPNEKIFDKTTFSAFTSTPLENYLKENHIQTLIFTGLATSQCVDTTARDAVDRGFDVVHIEDAQADYTEEFHHTSLYASIGVCGAHILKCENWIKKMETNSKD